MLPLLSVIISFLLGWWTSKHTFKEEFAKDKYLEFHNEVIKQCYRLPNHFLVNFETLYKLNNEDIFSKTFSENLIFLDDSRIEKWIKFNYVLRVYETESTRIPIKNEILLPLLNYYSGIIILETLEESKTIARKLNLPEVAKELTSTMCDESFYEQKLPTRKVAREHNLEHLMPHFS